MRQDEKDLLYKNVNLSGANKKNTHLTKQKFCICISHVKVELILPPQALPHSGPTLDFNCA